MRWRAFNRLSPIGDERMDFNQAMTTHVIANVNRNPKRRASAFTLADFLPPWGRKAPQPEAVFSKFKAAVAHLVGKKPARRKPADKRK